MVYNNWDCSVFGLCPSSHMLKNTKQHFGKWISFHSQVRGWETPTVLSPLERANLNCSTTNPAESVPPSPHLMTETDPFSKTAGSLVLFRIWDDGQSQNTQLS